MGWRKGYASEYIAKNKLVEEFGFLNVFKNAICNQGADYLVFKEGRLIKAVEVKECHKDKYYPDPKQLSQFKRIKEFCDSHKIPNELWVHYPKTKTWVYTNVEEYLK